MSNRFFSGTRRYCLRLFYPRSSCCKSWSYLRYYNPSTLSSSNYFKSFNPWTYDWSFRNLSFGHVNLVLQEGKPKFKTQEMDPPKKHKWKTKKRLKMQRKREKQKRKSLNKRDPRRLGVKGKKKKQKFANSEERIKYKIEKAKIKEALLIERLKRYEVPKTQGPVTEPEKLTGEERFYMKKMAQKGSNYVPIGKRGVFGGVILNMHMHWKKHETVKVFCKPCKPGQVHEYAKEIARLSGGIPIQIIGNDTIVFYRGKNYVQPEVMSPVDTLSKKRALEKSKYEQSLESVRRFLALSEKELELYYRHVALYGDPNSRIEDASVVDKIKVHKKTEKCELEKEKNIPPTNNDLSAATLDSELNEDDDDSSAIESEIEVSSEEENKELSVTEMDDEVLSAIEFEIEISSGEESELSETEIDDEKLSARRRH